MATLVPRLCACAGLPYQVLTLHVQEVNDDLHHCSRARAPGTGRPTRRGEGEKRGGESVERRRVVAVWTGEAWDDFVSHGVEDGRES